MKIWLLQMHCDTEGEEPKYSEKNLCQKHFVRDKSHIDWPKTPPGSSWLEAGDWLPESLHGR